jgi:TRAP-type transport system periplasmic protein
MSGHVYDPAVILMSEDAFRELSADERVQFAEAAKLAGQTSRTFAAEADARGVERLVKSGMFLSREINHDAFALAMSSALPSLEARFGRQLISQIRAEP